MCCIYIIHTTYNIVSQFFPTKFVHTQKKIQKLEAATINMSQFLYSLTIVFVFVAATNIEKTAASPPSYSQNHKAFVKTACNSTTSPDKCYKSLSSYSSTIKSDPIKLCTTALNLNVKSAKEATSVVSKLLKKSQKSTAGRKDKMLPETLILKDCLEEMKDTIIELKQAITEMKNLEMKNLQDGGSVAEHITNVRTWVSSALTDEGTCTDGFEEVTVNKETKKKVSKVVEELATTTSNTLALITNLRY